MDRPAATTDIIKLWDSTFSANYLHQRNERLSAGESECTCRGSQEAWQASLAKELHEQHPKANEPAHVPLIALGCAVASSLIEQAIQLAEDPMPRVLVLF